MDRMMRGFTLIEAMIVVAILGIIVAFGYPSYRDQVMKSRRAEGMGELLELADRMERYYSDKGTYATATLGTTSADVFHKMTDKGNYQLNIDSADSVAFVVSAKPQGGQAKDKCGTFILHSDGNKEVAPPPSLTTTDSTMVGECWK